MRKWMMVAMLIAAPSLVGAQTVAASNGGATANPQAPSVALSTPTDSPLPPIDAATKQAAQKVVDQIVPHGVFGRQLRGSLQRIVPTTIDNMMSLPASDIARLTGITPEAAAKLDRGTIRDIMAVIDPHFRDRMVMTQQAMWREMGAFLDREEPLYRAAYVQAYATRFTKAQLDDISVFFATPSGQLCVQNISTLSEDPAIQSATQAMIPRLVAALPTMMAEARKAAAGLPLPTNYRDLTIKQREQIAALLKGKVSYPVDAPSTTAPAG